MANVIALPCARGADYGDWLPSIVRIVDFSHKPNRDGSVENSALVTYGMFEGQVKWVSQHPDSRLRKGYLARIEWPKKLSKQYAGLRIVRMLPQNRPIHGVNLFETIPDSWVPDRMLVEQAALLWESLPCEWRSFFNELFWNSRRFYQFLTVPGSLHGHHNEWNGNFAHAVDVAERVQEIAGKDDGISIPLLITAGLIHDAGKGEEYRWAGSHWTRTDAGALIGHKDVLKGWIGAVIERARDILPNHLILALWHTLFSAKNAPAYLDIRESCMIEADVLSMADRLSGATNLHARLVAPEGGFGRRHQHLRARPFRLLGSTTN